MHGLCDFLSYSVELKLKLARELVIGAVLNNDQRTTIVIA